MFLSSIFRNYQCPFDSHSLDKILDWIFIGTHAKEVSIIRNEEDESLAQAKQKLLLPAFSIAGTFEIPRFPDDGLKLERYNALFLLRINYLSNPDLNRVRWLLQTDRHVYAYFSDARNEGLNIIIQSTGTAADHFDQFHHIKKHYERKLEVKISKIGERTEALCFMSHDKYRYLNTKPEAFLKAKPQGEVQAMRK